MNEAPAAWEALTDGDGEAPKYELTPGLSGDYEGFAAGIANYFGHASSDNRYAQLNDYANWTDMDTSPLMISCLNTNEGDNDGSSEMEHMGCYDWGVSHKADGSKAVMYDSSARWITREEIRATLDWWLSHRCGWMRNDAMYNRGKVQYWAKTYANPTRP